MIISKCQGEGCKSADEIDEYLSNTTFQAIKADNYVDFDDIDNPLHSRMISYPIGSFGLSSVDQYPLLTQLGSNMHWHVPNDSKTLYTMG